MSVIDSRIKLKRSSVTTAVPSIGPSNNHRDGTWDEFDIYPGELFVNLPDGKIWIGSDLGVALVPTSLTGIPFQFYVNPSPEIEYDTSIVPVSGANINTGLDSSILGGTLNIIDSDKSSILAGTLNDTAGFDNVHILGSNITADAADTTFVETLNAKNGIMNEDSGIVLRKKIIDIGDWDMNLTGSLNIAHGLSATEWKTIRTVTVIIRNDVDTQMYFIDGVFGTGTSTPAGGIGSMGSTNILLERLTGGFFDQTGYDSTGYNRGWVTLEYTPD